MTKGSEGFNIQLIQTTDRFLLIPSNKSSTSPNSRGYGINYTLEINKVNVSYKQNTKINGAGDIDQTREKIISETTIAGLVGVFTLLSGKYLVVYEDAPLVALVGDSHRIYQVGKCQIIPFHINQQSLITIPEYNEEMAYLDMIRWMLQVDSFYFSWTFNITNTLQRTLEQQSSSSLDSNTLIKSSDSRFFWNKEYTQEIVDAGCGDFVRPITFGFVQSKSFDYSGQNYTLTLISRRNLNRAGTRYNVRGADKLGNVANNVETEQIISLNGSDDNTYCSLVQVRGSVPILWSQYPDAKYKPKVQFHGTDSDNARTCQNHFTSLHQIYGERIVVVNLIDKKSDELKLGEAFEKHVKNVTPKPPRYVWFDFHHICKGMRYDKLSLLVDDVKQEVDQFSYLYVKQGKIIHKQVGTFRTNCIDNLDRTNVVQGLFAKTSLKNQINEMGVDAGLLTSSQFDHVFKNIWADHADRISTQYSGTGALKNDYTRTGKRGLRGVLNDGENSVKRYYLNNFVDGFRQDAYDLFTGSYKLKADKLMNPRHPTQMFWIVLLQFFALMVYTFVLPSGSSFTNNVIIGSAFWGLTVFGTSKLVKKYNKVLVDKPTLFKPDSVYK